MKTTTPLLAAALLAATALSACGDSDASSSDGSTAAGSTGLRLDDGVVRAADSGMTAAFGTLVNDGDEDVVVVSATSDVAEVMELHEVVESDGAMVMQEKDGGFVVPAGGSHLLEAGGDHVMFMGLTDGLEAGETVTWTLELEDGSVVELSAPVRDIAAGDEEYMGDMEMGDDMDMESGDTESMEPGDAESGMDMGSDG
ncbi:copper chaperone PCu(A)C [Jannaschia sp. R86511]|uniref:copper chaperone PCu(A)C n=1 Tax=Jannaschia sp. R86511 TaxID=3093853 RepID=UPI0036D3C133